MASENWGILFGFIAIFIVVLAAYSAVWYIRSKREEKKEAARKADLIERGFGPSAADEEKGLRGGNGVNGTGTAHIASDAGANGKGLAA